MRLLPFLPSPSILEAKIEGRVYNVIYYTGVLKNVLMGHWGMVSTTGGRNDTSGATKEPYHRCAEGAGGKNWPKREKVPRTLIIR